MLLLLATSRLKNCFASGQAAASMTASLSGGITSHPLASAIQAQASMAPTLQTAEYGTPSDAFYNDIVLMLYGDGAQGGTTFTDSGPLAKVPTSATGAITDQVVAPKYGSASIKITNGGFPSGLRYTPVTDFQPGTGNMTVECWVRNIQTGTWTVFEDDSRLQIVVSDTVGSFWSNVNWGGNTIFALAACPLNQWVHLATVKEGLVVSWYVDGVRQGTTTLVDHPTDGPGPDYFVGNSIGSSPTYAHYIDDVRITRAARYSGASFTPPTSFALQPMAVRMATTAQGSAAITATVKTVIASDRADLKAVATLTADLSGGITVVSMAANIAAQPTLVPPLLQKADYGYVYDPHSASVVLKISFAGADQSQTIDDESDSDKTQAANTGKIVTAFGAAGSPSSFVNGLTPGGAGLSYAASADWSPGSGDYTWEFWIRNVQAGQDTFIYHELDGVAVACFQFYASTGGNYEEHMADNQTDTFGSNSGYTFATNVWQHFMWVKSGLTIRTFVNGVQGNTRTLAAHPAAATTKALYIGSGGGTAAYMWGIDGIRFTKGVARKSANFTPPSTNEFYGDYKVDLATAASGTATITASLSSSGAKDLAATPAAVATITATLETPKPISANAVAVATLTADLLRTSELAAALQSIASFPLARLSEDFISSEMLAQASMTATLLQTVQLEAALAASAAMTGVIPVVMQADAVATPLLTADLFAARTAYAEAIAQASISATVGLNVRLAAGFLGEATIVAGFSGPRPLEANLIASASIIADVGSSGSRVLYADLVARSIMGGGGLLRTLQLGADFVAEPLSVGNARQSVRLGSALQVAASSQTVVITETIENVSPIAFLWSLFRNTTPSTKNLFAAMKSQPLLLADLSRSASHTCAATPSGRLAITAALNVGRTSYANLVALSTATAALKTDKPLSTAAQARLTITAGLHVPETLYLGAVPWALGSLTATLSKVTYLGAALQGRATIVAQAVQDLPLYSPLVALAEVTAGLYVNPQQLLAATPAASLSITAGLISIPVLSSTVVASASASASLRVDKVMASAALAQGTLAGYMAGTLPLASALSATATLTTPLGVQVLLGTAPAATATMTGSATFLKSLGINAEVVATITADLGHKVANTMATTPSVSAVLSASISVVKAMASAAVASATTSAALRSARVLGAEFVAEPVVGAGVELQVLLQSIAEARATALAALAGGDLVNRDFSTEVYARTVETMALHLQEIDAFDLWLTKTEDGLLVRSPVDDTTAFVTDDPVSAIIAISYAICTEVTSGITHLTKLTVPPSVVYTDPAQDPQFTDVDRDIHAVE